MGTPKHRLCVPTIYVLSKNKENIEHFLLKIFIFYNFINHCILHGQVFVMEVEKIKVHCVKVKEL